MPKHYISNKDETVRMFESDFLEIFSKVHFSLPIFIYVPVILYFLYHSIWTFHLNTLTIIFFFFQGVIIWSITEYALHRFIFHYNPTSEMGKKLHFIFHGVHHDFPNDSKRLVMPPSVSVPLALFFFYLFEYIFGRMLVSPFFVGFITGYLFYDLTHYAIHHYNMHNKFWIAIKNHHMRHHYMDSTKGFGVSSPVWDSLIGTNFPKKQP